MKLLLSLWDNRPLPFHSFYSLSITSPDVNCSIASPIKIPLTCFSFMCSIFPWIKDHLLSSQRKLCWKTPCNRFWRVNSQPLKFLLQSLLLTLHTQLYKQTQMLWPTAHHRHTPQKHFLSPSFIPKCRQIQNLNLNFIDSQRSLLWLIIDTATGGPQKVKKINSPIYEVLPCAKKQFSFVGVERIK